MIVLRAGDLLLGWQEYEWRWKTQAHFPRPSPRFYPPRIPTPHWTGGGGGGRRRMEGSQDVSAGISGKTIFLHAEQGFGDTIQFCRYAPLVAARGAMVVMEVHAELHRLLQGLEGIEQTIARGQTVPRFDLHCPLMSLPLVFGTTLETIPADVPYLRPDAKLVDTWRAIVGPAAMASLRVGYAICWAGSPAHADDPDIDRSPWLNQLRAGCKGLMPPSSACRKAPPPPRRPIRPPACNSSTTLRAWKISPTRPR